jgi:hypothetical protein
LGPQTGLTPWRAVYNHPPPPRRLVEHSLLKDNYGWYLVAPDPSGDQVNTAWGIEVLTTTQNPPGQGLLIDTTKFGRVAVREPLGLFIGYSNNDFTRNLLRWAAEERLVLTVERPAAVLAIKSLPAPTTRTAPAKK